jgi:cytochrome P450
VTEAQPLVFATPQAPAGTLSGRAIAKALRDNALLAFPPEAFEDEVVHRSFFGRQQIILNRPAAIHHILVENPDNYRRTPATMRILRPLLGNGLLLSEGEDWKFQRRTVAPAFVPRTMPLLTRHVARAAEATVASLAGSAERHVDLLAVMQSLALEIAGTSMFSLAMERYRPELRDLIARYAKGLGRPTLLDFLLPLGIPSPRDFARRRVRRRWVALIRRIIAERRVRASQAAPHDLFDLLSMARDPESGAPFPAEALLDQVATLITAGHETTGVALFWSLWLVAAAPDIQERISDRIMRPRSCGGSSIRAQSCTRRCASIPRPIPWCGKQRMPTTPVGFRSLPPRSCSSRPGCCTGIGGCGRNRKCLTQCGFCPAHRRPTASLICRSASVRACASAHSLH